MELIFATNNQHKVQEVQKLIGEHIKIKSLRDFGYDDELQEHHDTFHANACQKAWFIFNKFKVDCFAEDSGLEIEHLNGAPGVYSARYAGTRNPDDNINKVMKEMEGADNRKAQFRSVITLVINKLEHNFEGLVTGKIATERSGKEGFGYDPIFIPDGYNDTFAELTAEEKNKISHRAKAMKNMIKFINDQYAHLIYKEKEDRIQP